MHLNFNVQQPLVLLSNRNEVVHKIALSLVNPSLLHIERPEFGLGVAKVKQELLLQRQIKSCKYNVQEGQQKVRNEETPRQELSTNII